MNSRHRRWVSVTLLAAFAFAQATVVLAGCLIDRGAIADAVTSSSENDAGCDNSPMGNEPMNSAVCVAHCTSDLQAAGTPVAMVAATRGAPILVVPLGEPHDAIRAALESPPPETVPPRIRFQSFLI